MKKFVLLLFFIGGLVSAQAQESMSNDSMNETHKTLILKLGVNLVDSTGDDNPFSLFSNFDEMAFSSNYNVELEYRFSKWFSLAAALSNNKWKANKGNIDGIIINSDQKYLAIDLDLKYYYDEAISTINDLQPKLIFLDIVMQDGTGFDVLDGIEYDDYSAVFITAFQEYAVTAFKFNAIDFLLKPIDPKDLIATVKILEDNLKNKLFTTNPQLESAKTSIEAKTSVYNFIAIPSTKKLTSLK